MQDIDTGIDTIFNVSIYHVLQYLAIIRCVEHSYNFYSISQIIELALQ